MNSVISVHVALRCDRTISHFHVHFLVSARPYACQHEKATDLPKNLAGPHCYACKRVSSVDVVSIHPIKRRAKRSFETTTRDEDRRRMKRGTREVERDQHNVCIRKKIKKEQKEDEKGQKKEEEQGSRGAGENARNQNLSPRTKRKI